MNSQNPYQPPEADLQKNHPQAHTQPLCSIAGIGLAALLGSPLAAAFFITRNLKAMGRDGEVRKTWIFATLLFLVLSGISFVLPPSIPGIVFTLPQILGMISFARQLFGPQLKEHQESGLPLMSLWRVALISLIFTTVLVLVLTLLLYDQF